MQTVSAIAATVMEMVSVIAQNAVTGVTAVTASAINQCFLNTYKCKSYIAIFGKLWYTDYNVNTGGNHNGYKRKQ